MLGTDDLVELASGPESSCLDFKREQYDFSQPGSKGGLALVKDILCMANTPRDGNAYILTGVAEDSGKPNTITGIKQSVDDSRIQDLLSAWLKPIPSVEYYELFVDDKVIGVYEIHPARQRGPSYVRDDLNKSKRKVCGEFFKRYLLYFRRSTKNDLANEHDKRDILNWFRWVQEDRREDWEAFKRCCNDFDRRQHFVLITSSMSHLEPADRAALSQVNWTAVLDFDSASDENGLLASRQAVRDQRHEIRVVRGECLPFDAWRNAYWFLAQGLAGRPDTLPKGEGWVHWYRSYGSEINNQMCHIAQVLLPSAVTFVVLWSADTLLDHLRSALESTLIFEDAKYVIVSDAISRIKTRVTNYLEASYFDIPLDLLASGLRNKFQSDNRSEVAISFPSESGVSVAIPDDRLPSLSSYLDLIHLNLGMSELQSTELETTEPEFLRGGVIDWQDLELRRDADRDITKRLKRTAEQDLSKRHTGRINLYHHPGAGGTTVSKRIAWDLHDSYPCVSIRSKDTQGVASSIEFLSAKTRLPVLAIADSAIVTKGEVIELTQMLQARRTGCVLLFVSRQHSLSIGDRRSFRLEMRLSKRELQRFVAKFVESVPDRGTYLRDIARNGSREEQTAFFIGLTAYGKAYHGLKNVVASRIQNLSHEQERLLVYLSIAYMYGQRGIPAQAFSSLLGISRGNVRLDAAFAERPSILDILISADEGRTWRPIHDSVAQEILQQTLAPHSSDNRVWKQQLSSVGKEFVDFCRGTQMVVGEQMMEVLRQVFIERDTTDDPGREANDDYSTTVTRPSKFSRLIQDIPAREGRLETLKHLTDLFPSEAHFWAHLGRFQSDIMENYEASLEAAERAIELNPNDPTLWHMKGMSFRRHAEALMADSASELQAIVVRAEQSSECFEESRRIDPYEEHPYISEVELLVKLLNFAARESGGNIFRYFKRYDALPYLRDAFDKAESLLSIVQTIRKQRDGSEFEQRCRASVRRLYGDYSEALTIWDNLLDRTDVFHPPVRRQIVYAHLDRSNSWTDMQQRDRDRCIRLLEDNLDEQAYNERDLRLWLQAVRYTKDKPTIDSVIEKVSYWKTNTSSLDATYYFYVLYAMKALEGLAIERNYAQRFIRESALESRNRVNRHRSFEWLGSGDGIGKLVHQSALGNWNSEINFWANTHALERVDGVITRVRGPQQGTVQIQGLDCFFVPSAKPDEPITADTVNRRVSFYLGFSYSGIRAWDVKLL